VIDGNAIDEKELGDILGYATVYYHPQVTANVLSFHNNMANRLKSAVYINCQQDAFVVTRDNDTFFTFVPSKERLHFHHFHYSINRDFKEMPDEQNTMFINTIEQYQQNYTARELNQKEAASRLYMIMGRPSKEDFNNMIKSGKI
jgi:hypothetical protein